MSKVFSDSAEMKSWQLPEIGQSDAITKQEPGRSPAEEEGYLRGYKEGLLSGYEEAYLHAQESVMEQCKKDLELKKQQINDIIQALQKPLILLDHKVEHEVVNLIRVIVQKICRSQLQLKPKLLQKVVRDAIKLLPIENQQVTIIANHTDAEVLSEIILQMDDYKCEIKEDAALRLGDVLVRTQHTEIDVGINTRLQNLLEQITDYENSANAVTAAKEISS